MIVNSELMEGAWVWEDPFTVRGDGGLRIGAKRLYVMAGRIAVTIVDLQHEPMSLRLELAYLRRCTSHRE